LLELNGGNDGLNTVVPYADPGYAAQRPTLAVPRDRVLQLDERLGLNPALEPLMPAWRDGNLAVALGVGYPRPNRSHFRSIEIWNSASSAEETLRDGWLHRVLVETAAAEAPPPGHVSLYAPRYDAVEDKCVDYRETVSDPRAELPTRGHERREIWEALTHGCNQRERLMLIGLYQLGQTMAVVGRTLGLSENRVSQMHRKVLARLRAKEVSHG
jgi:uncharacterized protein (DUF1501 family)